jgi:hypothetical protein
MPHTFHHCSTYHTSKAFKLAAGDPSADDLCGLSVASYVLGLFEKEGVPLTEDISRVETVTVPVNDADKLFKMPIDTGLGEGAVLDAALGFCLTHLSALGLVLTDVEGCVKSVVSYVDDVLATAVLTAQQQAQP